MDTVELRPGLLHMFRFSVGQAYLWRDAAALTLIDAGPPGNGPAIESALGGLGLRLRDLDRIILTHFHEDHAGSAAAIAGRSGASVLAHRWDAPVIRGDMPARRRPSRPRNASCTSASSPLPEACRPPRPAVSTRNSARAICSIWAAGRP